MTKITMCSVYMLFAIVFWYINAAVGAIVCPPNATRVINTTDLLSATTDPTNDDGVFENLLNTVPYWDISLRREWGSTDLPNQGNLTFNAVFVITQFITRGLVYRLNNDITMRYVSKFMLTYSAGEESSNFTTYPEVFTVNTVSEVLLMLQEPIVAKKLVLDILDAELAGGFTYYWHLSLIGCLYDDALDTGMSDAANSSIVNATFPPSDIMPTLLMMPNSCIATTASLVVAVTIIGILVVAIVVYLLVTKGKICLHGVKRQTVDNANIYTDSQPACKQQHMDISRTSSLASTTSTSHATVSKIVHITQTRALSVPQILLHRPSSIPCQPNDSYISSSSMSTSVASDDDAHYTPVIRY